MWKIWRANFQHRTFPTSWCSDFVGWTSDELWLKTMFVRFFFYFEFQGAMIEKCMSNTNHTLLIYIYMYIYLYVYINKHLFIYIYMTWNLDSETEFLKWKPDCTSALGNTPPTSFLMEKTNVEIKFIETGISSYMALNHCFQLKFSKHRLSCLAICFSGAF